MIGHVVYRAFDEAGALLYVGATSDLGRRFVNHKSGASWFDELRTITVAHYPTREESLAAERDAIASEGPRYNQPAHPPRRRANPIALTARGVTPLKLAIAASGMKVQDIASEMAIDPTRISRWASANSTSAPSAANAAVLARILGTTVEALWPLEQSEAA